MSYSSPRFLAQFLFIAALALGCAQYSSAQQQPGAPLNVNSTPPKDTSKTNNNKWHDEDTRISFKKAFSQIKEYPDTSLHTFHRRPFTQPWYRDLGNLGSPARSLLFTPDPHIGFTLGYHVYDVYRYDVDSLLYYNTTRPYTSFTYQMGSKLEQTARILHTQNITPNWNFAAQYQKITSPGFYKIQRNNNDNGAVTTNYQSKNLRYELYGGFVYNKEQHDENGGIIADSLLSDARYADRKTIKTFFQNDGYSSTRSSVTNNMRDFSIALKHAYTWGRIDTTYNEDSTRYFANLTPRFSISHQLELKSEKYQYKDIRPDSLRYVPLFTGKTLGETDSVFMQQMLFALDNKLMLNGFIGTKEKQLEFSAGIGNRIDQISTYFDIGRNKTNYVSNYLAGTIRKEALKEGQWHYKADVQFYFSGQAAGNFTLNGALGKSFKNNLGGFTLGVGQQLNNAPYSYTIHETKFDTILTSLNKQSITQLYANIYSQKLRLSGGVRTYIINNYIYFNQKQRPDQYATAFNVSQVWVDKSFRFGVFVLDNELAFQQVSGSAPVNLPKIMGRHQLAAETRLFRNALKIATGIEIRYHSAYYGDGYSAFFNRFYYQNAYEVSNKPEGSVFFNFKIKRFRAYIMGDQLQQFFYRNTIIAPGYAAQNAMLRFGFNWALVN